MATLIASGLCSGSIVRESEKQMSAGDGTKSHPTSFWLDDETKSTLERLMEELGTTRSDVIREAIRRMGDKEERNRNEIRKLVNKLSEIV